MAHPFQVVVAYDFSPSSEQALCAAVDHVARGSNQVLHVAAILNPHDRVTIAARHEPPTYETASTIQKLIMERVTAAFARRSTPEEVQFFVHARIGNAATEILELASEVGADLIFIGSHGKTGIERFLLGSVSECVVREARCPVMVSRPKTYANVDLIKVREFEHVRTPHREPHVYSYRNQQVLPQPWHIT